MKRKTKNQDTKQNGLNKNMNKVRGVLKEGRELGFGYEPSLG
jgi:hypothetical protein